MPRRPIALLIPLLAAISILLPAAVEAVPGSPRLQAPASRTMSPELLGPFAAAKGFDPSVPPSRSDKACVIMTMTCNSTVESVLTDDDCTLTDGTFFDFWEFPGTDGQTVTIDLTSSDFNTFLFLQDPTGDVVAVGGAPEPPFDSRIVFTLESSGLWAIGANAYFLGDLGDYRLSLECSGVGPPTAPSDLIADPLSDTKVELAWRDNSGNEDEFRVEVREEGGVFEDIGFVAANSTSTEVINLLPSSTYDFRVRARNVDGNSGYSNVATATTSETGFCAPSDSNLCLSSNRFKVEVDWRDFNDNTGSGRVVPFGSDDSGLFYFFAPDNWEMLVKVLDTCGSPFDTFWVFAAATTNVEYTLKVTDTETGAVEEYVNPLGNPSAAITDTGAFPCP